MASKLPNLQGPKTFLQTFFAGIRTPFQGVSYLAKHPKLWLFAIPPIIITGTLLSLATWSVWTYGTELFQNHIWSQPTGDSWTVSWLLNPLWHIVRVLAHAVAFVLSFVVGKLLAIPLAGPFNELLSEKIEHIETGFEAPFDLSVMVRNVFTSLAHVSLFLALEIIVFLLSFLLGLIPVVGPVLSALISFFVSPLIVGLIPFDYPMTLRLWRFQDKLGFMRRNFPFFFGFSLASFIILYIPFVNLLFLPACVTAATLTILRMTDDGTLGIEDQRKTHLARLGKISQDPPDDPTQPSDSKETQLA